MHIQRPIILLLLFFSGFFLSGCTLGDQRATPPSPAPATPAPIQSSEVFSSDEKFKLILESQQQGEGQVAYSLFTAKKSGEDKRVIFTTTESAGSMSIPRNAWSPDNKLLFIRIEKPDGLTFFVFKASGELFKNGEPFEKAQGKPYLDVGPLFAKKMPKYTMTDATGWASEILLIVTTETKEGKRGPLYWFEVPSSAFVQLAH